MVKVDFSKAEQKFATAMRLYAQLSNKEVSEALNKKAKDVAIRAIKYTPKADKGRIEQQLRTNGWMYRIIRRQGLTREQIKRKGEALLAAKKRSSGYIRAGWYKAAKAFGGRGGKTRPKGLAEQGQGFKASPTKLEATLINRAKGATVVAGTALAQAMDEVRKDMMKYIQRKLFQKWGMKR